MDTAASSQHKTLTGIPEIPENESREFVIHPGFPELDRKDVSTYPSYTEIKIPYRVVCRQRYSKKNRRNCKAFLDEVKFLEMMQSRALDGVRINRQFSRGIIEPEFKTLKQLKECFPDLLTAEQRWKLEQHIMSREFGQMN